MSSSTKHNTATKSFTIPDRWDRHLTAQLLDFTSKLADPNVKFAEIMRYALLKAFPDLKEIDTAKSGTLSQEYLSEQSAVFERLLLGEDVKEEWNTLQHRLKNGEFARKL